MGMQADEILREEGRKQERKRIIKIAEKNKYQGAMGQPYSDGYNQGTEDLIKKIKL